MIFIFSAGEPTPSWQDVDFKGLRSHSCTAEVFLMSVALFIDSVFANWIHQCGHTGLPSTKLQSSRCCHLLIISLCCHYFPFSWLFLAMFKPRGCERNFIWLRVTTSGQGKLVNNTGFVVKSTLNITEVMSFCAWFCVSDLIGNFHFFLFFFFPIVIYHHVFISPKQPNNFPVHSL